MANLGTINTGMVFGFSAVTIPQLQEADSFIKIDEEQASWIGKHTELVDGISSNDIYNMCKHYTNFICTYAP